MLIHSKNLRGSMDFDDGNQPMFTARQQTGNTIDRIEGLVEMGKSPVNVGCVACRHA